MDAASVRQYLTDDPPTIVPLAIKPHFEALNDQEQKYAHFISRAALSGTRIVLRQVSPESEPTYDAIVALDKEVAGNYSKVKERAGLSDEDVKHYLSYAAQFLGNGGNYKSFGDSKFIPRISPAKLEKLFSISSAASKHLQAAGGAQVLYETKAAGLMHLGYPSKGHLSTYYPDSAAITEEEIEYVATWLSDWQLLPENTRLRKTSSGDFEVLIASASTSPSPSDMDVKETEWSLMGKMAGKKLKLIYGDHQREMQSIADALAQAQKHAANENQASMQGDYVKSFASGSMEAHKDSQRHWIRDKGPNVECNIGFIETYRDPHGIRGEWEGFAAMVNKERTKAFGKLVESAPEQIPKLPWGKEFEKDTFLSPDFTSLEVLTFAGSGIPAGINIPNYDDIRQREGFKNVSLGNVLSAKPPDEKRVPFIGEQDTALYKEFADQAFEVQVGLHELLGHGCGKLLQETSPGEYNFDHSSPPISPIDGKPITSWYKPGQTWGSVFGGLSPTIEEARAELVAMSLCCDFRNLATFGFAGAEGDMASQAGKVLYASYLSMARAGVAALQFWDPASGKWGQAHMQARHAILKVFLDAGKEKGEFCRLELKRDGGRLVDLDIVLDREKIISVGKPAVDAFLQKVQIYKATADVKKLKELYEGITTVDGFWADEVRPVVLAKALPRKVFVQANTFLEGDKVVLREYPATAEGMIKSFVDRDYV